MGKETLQVAVGAQAEAKGFKIKTESISILDKSTDGGEVTNHELDHVLGTDPGNVDFVTIRPGPDYRGLTKYHKPDIVGAVAAHAKGRSGTGWDMFVAHRSGGNVGSAMNSAVARLSSNEIYRRPLAYKLEKLGSMSGGEVGETIMEVNEEVILGKKTQVEIVHPDGRREKRIERARANVVEMQVETRPEPVGEAELPKAA